MDKNTRKNRSKSSRRGASLKPITPAQKKFAHVYARTNNATEAVRQAFPESAGEQSEAYLSLKGHRMIRNDRVQDELVSQKQRMELLASRAVSRISRLVESDDESIAGTNARWAYEQVHGKATVKVEQKSAHVEVIYNLQGSDAPEIPQEIKDKLKNMGA